MLPLKLGQPFVDPRQLAAKVVARRLAFGWTREELAARAGVAKDTLKRFEQTGRISLERLLRLAAALDATTEFGALFPVPVATSLDELERLEQARRRQRGVGRRRGRRKPERDAQA